MKKLMLDVRVTFRPATEMGERPFEADGIESRDGMLRIIRDNFIWAFPLELVEEVFSREYEIDVEED